MKKSVLLAVLSSLLVAGCGSVFDVKGGISSAAHVSQLKSLPTSCANRTLEPHEPMTTTLPANQAASQPVALHCPPPHTATDTQQRGNVGLSGGTQSSTGVQSSAKKARTVLTETDSGQGVNVNESNHEPPLAASGKNVVLTFDDGPSPWTLQLIQTLDAESVPAVMFWNTYHISFANDKVRTLLKTSPNIQVGDHTVDHPNLLKLGYTDQYHEIADAKRTIEETTGLNVQFFRPPYGNYNATTEQVLNSVNLSFVMWDVDSLDWKYNGNETALLNQIKRQLRPGAIILMHDHYYTVKYLPDIIAMLRKEGYGFTTITKESKQEP